MKAYTLALLGLGVVALLYVGNLAVAGNVLQCYIQSVNFTGLTSGTIVLVVQNPSNASIELNSMAGTVSANGSLIGNISNFQGGVAIPANQQVPVNITVNLSLASLIGGLYSALTSPTGTNNIAFVIAASANINGGVIVPLNITQTVTV
jgi:hypothetical protein